MARWKEELFEFDSRGKESLNQVHEKSYNTKPNDIGLINPLNGAGLLVRENKKIEAFSDYGLGFRIDPESQSFAIFAPTIKFFANEVKTYDHEESKTYLKEEYKDILDLLKEGE